MRSKVSHSSGDGASGMTVAAPSQSLRRALLPIGSFATGREGGSRSGWADSSRSAERGRGCAERPSAVSHYPSLPLWRV